jgi:transglutaminase-like putative cysteine protease
MSATAASLAAARAAPAETPPRARPLDTQTLDAGSRRWSLAASLLCLLPLLPQLPGQLAVGVAGLAVLVPLLNRSGRAPAWLRLLLSLALIGTVVTVYGFRFGRDAGCGMLAALLALKPVEMHNRRDARSLVGFALFAPFGNFLLDQGPLSLVLALIGASTALAALLKLSEAEAGEHAAATPLWRRISATLRMVAIGLPLAMAAFWLFPRLGSPIWGMPDRAVARPGLSDRMSPGEWLELIGDETPALRVKFIGSPPSPAEMYFRGPVLWAFDGRTWTTLSAAQRLPAAPMRPGALRYEYELELEATDSRQMVALELPTAAPSDASLSLDYSLRARRPLTSLSRWRMQAAQPAQFEPDLDPRLRALALQLPQGFNPRTLALAARWRAEAGDGPQADAALVERSLAWVRKDFAYTLNTPLPGRDSVDEFLFDVQAGFCEHFSSSFVVLMRAAGIPARVVTGYAGGYRNPLGDYWLVRRSDAHAWAEVWLEGRGWVRVDPTAAVAPERIYDTIDDRTQAGFGGLGSVLDFGDLLRRGWNDFLLGFNADRQRQLLRWLGMPDLDPGKLSLLFILATLLALGGMWWFATRGERERDPLLRAWRRLEARYRRKGLGRAPHEPPQRWAARVLAARPQAEALVTLCARFTALRYAPPPADPQGARAALIRDLRRHRPPRSATQAG